MSETGDELLTVIAAQIACAEQILGVLDDEHRALLKPNVDELGNACSRKLELTRVLQQLGERHLARLKSQAGRPDGYAERRRRLQSLAERCDQANRINGALVDAREAQLRSVLNALQPQLQAVYGRHGATSARLPGRLYSQA